MLEGTARKIGLALALLTILPWLLIVIGFGLITAGFDVPPLGPALFPYWFISVLGIPIIVLGAVHAVISARSAIRILRTITTLFSVLFLLCLGMIFFQAGSFIITNISVNRSIYHPINLWFAGTLMATLFWTGQMMTWTFYEEDIITNQ